MTIMSVNKKHLPKSYLVGAVLWLVVLMLVGFFRHQEFATPPKFALPANTNDKVFNQETPFFIQSDISRTRLSVHASTLAEIKVGDSRKLMTAWFQGSREGARDVEIYASFLDLNRPLSLSQPMDNPWSKPKSILTPQMLAKQSRTYIKKLGNPVLYQSQDGTIHLFVVATSYGGWAASKIYHLTSTTGDEFKFKQILPLSPLLNVSHLVRVPPTPLADGGFYLPVYHELTNKFEVLLRFNKDGELIAKIRPNQLTDLLQPTLTPISEQDCLMTRRHRRTSSLLIQECHQGGLVWDKPIASNIKNDNNSLNIVSFNNTNYLIHNEMALKTSRFYLWLSKVNKNDDGFIVKKQLLLDSTNKRIKDSNGEVSYPTTLAVDGNLHVVYTHDRSGIRHIMMNQAFIDSAEKCYLISGDNRLFFDDKKFSVVKTSYCGKKL